MEPTVDSTTGGDPLLAAVARVLDHAEEQEALLAPVVFASVTEIQVLRTLAIGLRDICKNLLGLDGDEL